jgi:hypothetical protein
MDKRTVYRLFVEIGGNIRILKARISVIHNGGRPRHDRHISRRFRQKPNNPIVMVDILLSFHKIVDCALASPVYRLITARIFQEWLIRHIQQ